MRSRQAENKESENSASLEYPVFETARRVEHQDGRAIITFAVEYPGTSSVEEEQIGLALKEFGELLLMCKMISRVGPDHFQDLHRVLAMFRENLRNSDERIRALLNPNTGNR